MTSKRRWRFWWATAAGVAIILLLAAGCQYHRPWRWYPEYLAFLLPVLLCAAGAVYAGSDIGISERAASGLLQSVSFLFFFAEGHLDHQYATDSELAFKWSFWVVFYTLIFAVITQWLVSVLSVEGSRNARLPHVCERCGYNLTGLNEPRCPECGTPFPPSLLQDEAIENSEELEESDGTRNKDESKP